MVKFAFKQRKLRKISSFSIACLRGKIVTIVESSETYVKLKGTVQKLFSMICFHLHRVLGGQIWTKTAKIEQNCSIFPSLLKGLKCHHRRELQNLWQIKGFYPETLLNDLFHLHNV